MEQADAIVVTRGLVPRTAQVVLDGRDGPIVSDHLGVRVELDPEPVHSTEQW